MSGFRLSIEMTKYEESQESYSERLIPELDLHMAEVLEYARQKGVTLKGGEVFETGKKQ